MEVVIADRQMGKTVGSIAWLVECEDHVLLVINEAERERLRKKYPLVADRIYTWQYWVSDGRAWHNKYVVIDNVDMILEHLVNAPIVRMTLRADN
jgi:hypothetical protein